MGSDRDNSASKMLIFTIIKTGVHLITTCLPIYRPLAIFLWRISPLSFLRLGIRGHLGAGGEKLRPTKATHGAYETPPECRLENGFTRLQKDNMREVHPRV